MCLNTYFFFLFCFLFLVYFLFLVGFLFLVCFLFLLCLFFLVGFKPALPQLNNFFALLDNLDCSHLSKSSRHCLISFPNLSIISVSVSPHKLINPVLNHQNHNQNIYNYEALYYIILYIIKYICLI
jgi:hypothetical protein